VWFKTVANVPGNHVEVKVKRLLSGCLSRAVFQGQSVRLEGSLDHSGHVQRGGCNEREFVLRKVPEIRAMGTGHDQSMARRRGRYVQERDDVPVLVDDVGGCSASSDLTEGARHELLSHPRQFCPPRLINCNDRSPQRRYGFRQNCGWEKSMRLIAVTRAGRRRVVSW